ncbi:hypothetical protein L207DRAFT_492191 [Hyaloscypha variabilis F]|uniref:ER lumen protein retaining receptor n=1 Tax=Hyaloscypha variabilis (strain UAMH 11265 / GT02V1 / F) TaxID=1149755 RepID=A0A2J6RIP8_HYAVF|nr:hypothetical protein L207DRAFT_492191 [Hyaloscypha variabilis F]
MAGMNPFRILADISHTLSKCILIYAIHRNSSTEGVSLITQALYCLVFVSRYLDLFMPNTPWNTTLKIFYILSSIYILFLMLRVYARTRERETAWKLGAFSLVGSAIAAPFVMMIFKSKTIWGFTEVAWVFSIILESVCVLPQLVLLRQTTVPTVIDSYYLVTLGSYRGFYILNWIWREIDPNETHPPDAISIIFGVIQTAFYIDFAWVYYSRQRVKLRNGGIVDADDMRNSWLLRTVFRHKAVVGHDDEESAPALGGSPTGNGRPNGSGRNGSKWGARGISVSADDGVLEGERERQNGFLGQEEGVIDTLTGEETDPDAKMKDPDELARILDDDDDDDDGVLPGGESSERVGNGSEWRDGSSK